MMSRIVIALACLFAIPGLANAQFAVAPDAQPVVYRLNEAASFTQGCYPPCLCPLFHVDNTRGTFTLQRSSVNGNVFTYRVEQVNWYVGEGDSETKITGSGTYTRISGFAGWSHQMELNLSLNGGAVTQFDSGLVNGGGDFPNISGLQISVNGMVCFDTVIAVDASPVPSDQIRKYCLGPKSEYQEGCLPPCLCPILASLRLHGRFALVELRDLGTVIEYAVVNMDMQVVSLTPVATPSSTFEGAGRYTRISGIAGWVHRMELNLSIDGDPPTAFDSGLVNGGGDFPRIEIAVAMNDFFCYDIVLTISARPCPAIRPASSALGADRGSLVGP